MDHAVVPWKCHICLKEVSEASAATCSRCNEIMCPEHTLTVRDTETGDKLKVCSKCIRDSDDVKDMFYKIKRACRIPSKK